MCILSKGLVIHFFVLPLTACGSLIRLARVWQNVLGLVANLWLALACVQKDLVMTGPSPY
jgi:hypothetical protein